VGIFDMISSFMNPQQGYENAEKPINNAWNQAQNNWNQAKSYQTPYISQGQGVYPQLQGNINKLLDPTQLESQWANSYEMSPYAKNLLGMNQEEGLDAASSMGLMGSSAALNNIQRGAGNIVSADRKQYMQDLMDKFLQGLGLSSKIYDTGASMASNLGGQAINMGQMGQKTGEDLAGLEYGRTNAPGNMFENLLKTGTSLFAGGQDSPWSGIKNSFNS